MKRTSLTTAVIAGIAGVAGISNLANAVYLNGDGLGQALIYPYYTVNPSNGSANSTALTIVNTTNQGKAIKVRFLEGYNSREVLDFNLYMSPYDVWTGQIVPNGVGAGVFSRDNSCTVPTLPTSAPGFAFSSFGYDGTTLAKDGGPTDLTRTTEGYVEMIEMGTVTNASANHTLTAITHVNGVPKNCGQLITAFTPNSSNPYWVPNNGGNLSTDIGPASGGLFGSGTIVNVVAGTVEGYNAEAIDRYWDVYPLATFNHTDPSSLAPSIAGGSSLTSYVFAQTSATVSGSQLITTDYTSARDAVSSLFMADTIYNEYWTGGGTALSSEWVVTFPTKRFYVDAQLYVTSAQPPFDVIFDKTVGNNGLPGSSCSPVGVGFYDREERTPGVQQGNICPSPLTCGPQVTTTTLCYEANVVTFNQAGPRSAVLGSNLVTSITTGYNNGWANIDLVDIAETNEHYLPSGASSNEFLGLPATGFWVTQFINANVSNGVLANYTSLYKHKLHRACTSEGACS